MNRRRRDIEQAVLGAADVADRLAALAINNKIQMSDGQRTTLRNAAYMLVHLQTEVDRFRAPNPAEATSDFATAKTEHARLQEMLTRYPNSHQWVLGARLRRARLEAMHPDLALVGAD